MASIAVWLLALVTPLAKQVLVGLGFGFVTYTGVSVAFDSMVASLTGQLSSIPPDVVAYANLSGVFDAMGLILAALSFKISFMSMSRMIKL